MCKLLERSLRTGAESRRLRLRPSALMLGFLVASCFHVWPVQVFAPNKQLTIFGDSITVGNGATAPEKAWVALLRAETGFTLMTNCYGGATTANFAEQIWTSTVTDLQTSLYCLGFNDSHCYTTGVQRATFQKVHLGSVACLSLSSSQKIFGTNTAAITYVGTWDDLGSLDHGKYSTTQGDTATFTGVGSGFVFGTVGCPPHEAVGGGFSITVDGTVVENGSCILTSEIVPKLHYVPIAYVVDGLHYGYHTAVITVTSATSASNLVFVEWGAFAGGIPFRKLPTVYVANALQMTSMGYETWGGDVNNTALCNELIRDNCDRLARSGLNVQVVDWKDTVDLSDTDDGVHPGDTGHRAITDEFEALLVSPEFHYDYLAPVEYMRAARGLIAPAPRVKANTPSEAVEMR